MGDATGARRLAGLTAGEAERLLAWLTANGCRNLAAGFPGRKQFVVRWRPE